MYAYFIDDWVYGRKHKRNIDRLDLLLTQHGIVGRKIKLGRLHDLSNSVKDCFDSGVKTFVAVGNDTTANRLLNHILKPLQEQGNKASSFAFGVLPIHEPRVIASGFLCPTLQGAVDALTARTTKKIDIGLLNDRHYFITAAVFPQKTSLGFLSYTVSSMRREHHVSICNMNIYKQALDVSSKKFNISDKMLEAVIAYKPEASFFDRVFKKENNQEFIPESIFPIKNITIKHKQKTITVHADTEKQLTTPVRVEIIPHALDVIVGKKGAQ